VRAHLRAAPGSSAATPSSALENVAAVARARHLALVRRAACSGRLDASSRLHARPVRVGDEGLGAGARADAAQPRRLARADLLRPACCCARRGRLSARGAYAIVQRNAMRAWETGEQLRDLSPPTRRPPAGRRRPRRAFDLRRRATARRPFAALAARGRRCA
jgi:hypothetical protein